VSKGSQASCDGKEQLSSPSGGLQETPKFERKRRTFRRDEQEREQHRVQVLSYELNHQPDWQIEKIKKEVNFQRPKDQSNFNSVVSVADAAEERGITFMPLGFDKDYMHQ
jgi:hypothetical protein